MEKNSIMNRKDSLKIKKLQNSFIRDNWGNLKECYWNEMIKSDILKIDPDYRKHWKIYL